MMLLKYFGIVLLFAASTAWAGDVEDADAALTKKDYVNAFKKYKSAALENNAIGQFMVGSMYDSGRGVAQNYAEAMRWYKLAASQGYEPAQINLGFMYGSGQGVVQDYPEAVRWYKLAAEQGSARAQMNLGFMYSSGQGVAQDYARAHMWANLAAVKGDADAIKSRNAMANKMTLQQIAEAQKMARVCQAQNFKNCD